MSQPPSDSTLAQPTQVLAANAPRYDHSGELPLTLAH
ncbi:MAG: hypothetical protein K0S77_2925 [Pseudomonas sp.]|jgi:hypothetical protein|nr:hypothetical protein [Pseudomonas sp.]